MVSRLNRAVATLLGAKPPGAKTAVEKTHYPRVDLTYWSPASGFNFGDYLSRVTVELTLASRGLTLGDEVRQQRQLTAIGSVLHFAQTGATVWGSGVNGKIAADRHVFDDLDVRAVRGPLTRAFLSDRGIAVPEVYGDPALLLPHLTGDRFKATRELGPVFVPNLNDLAHLDAIESSGVPIILPTQSWNRCVSAILRHSFVLASSLHGLIIAEAYGVPARFVRLSEHEHLFKYEDYYRGTGRETFAYATSIQQGLEMGGEPLPVFDHAKLLAAFPFDLWDAPAPV